MFLILITYTQPLAAVQQVLEAHRAYLRDAPEAAQILMTGRKRPATGGVILLRAADRAAADAFVQRDPYFSAGVAAFEVIEFDVAQAVPELARWLA